MLFEELTHYAYTTTFGSERPPDICETTFSKTDISKKIFLIGSLSIGLLIDAFFVGQ